MYEFRTKHRELTFYNRNEPHLNKVVHIPMEPAFCQKTRQLLIQSAKTLSIPVVECGTAIVIEGPKFSTLAESKVYRSWGADLVNMTLAPEVSLGLCEYLAGISRRFGNVLQYDY